MTPKQKRLTQYLLQIEQKMLSLYGTAYKKILNLDFVKEAILSDDEEFSFKKNPKASKEVERQLEELANKVSILTMNGVKGAYNFGEDDAISNVVALLGTTKKRKEDVETICKQAQKDYRSQGNNARQYANARRGGFSISQRVWNTTKRSKQEIEVFIQNGIIEGKSASDLSVDIRDNLRNPHKLFRSVRDKKTGELRLSKAAKMYHPGAGVYRSSYKNAMRLARTEVNNAYRSAECLSYNNNPLVKGYEIRLSNNHTTLVKGVPVRFHDICDELQGTYPKDFQWSGWHPQCRCAMIPIPLSPKEFGEYIKAKRRGEDVTPPKIKKLPPNYVKWIQDNEERIKEANVPYFLKDNARFTEEILNPKPKVKTPQEIAEERHKNRTEAQRKDIQRRWDERRARIEREKAEKRLEGIRRAQVRYGERIYRIIKDNYPQIDVTDLKYFLDARVSPTMIEMWAYKLAQEVKKLIKSSAQGQQSNKELEAIINDAENIGIKKLEVKDLSKNLSDEEIIDRVCGGDMTKGSCSSLAFAFLGNKIGLDVLDFRNGESLNFFATNANIRKITEALGGYIEKDYNDNKAAVRLLKKIEKGEYYYFATGSHAAVVKKTDRGPQYLELQDPRREGNTFYDLTLSELKSRFGTKKSHTSFGLKYETPSFLIPLENIRKNKDLYRKLMEFINTEESKQYKGSTGGLK